MWWVEEGDGEEGGEEDLSLSLSLCRIRMKHEIGSFHTGRGGEGGGGLRRLTERRAGVIPEAPGGLLEHSLSLSLSLSPSLFLSLYLSIFLWDHNEGGDTFLPHW